LGSPSSDVNWFSGSKNGGATIDAFMDAFVRRQKWGLDQIAIKRHRQWNCR